MRIGVLLPSFLCTLLLFTTASSYKILVFSPTSSRSHTISNGRIADALAKAGHDVTLFEPDIFSTNDTFVSAEHAKILSWKGFSPSLKSSLRGLSPFDEPSIWEVKRTYDSFNLAYNAFCEELFNKDDLLTLLSNENYDAFFAEQFSGCGHALAYHLNVKVRFLVSSSGIVSTPGAPVILTLILANCSAMMPGKAVKGSCPLTEDLSYIMGIPNPTSYVANLYLGEFGTRPTYWQRVRNMVYYNIVVMMTHNIAVDLDERLRGKFGPSFPSVESIVSDSDVLFIATDEFVDLPRPSIPNLVHIAGLGAGEKKAKPLDEVFSAEMSKGPNGVVFFSMGTIVNTTTLPHFFIEGITNLIKTYPELHFIVKVDKYDKVTAQLVTGLQNVFLTQWAPQTDILNHPRLRVFITHAGYNGIMEAARAGVPLLCIPMLFDQPKNSFAVEENGWGLRVNRFSLKDEPHLLQTAFNDLLHKPQYKEGAKRISKLLKTKPFQAEELLVKYTDFAIRNGGLKELRIEERHLNFFVYHNLDIIVPFFFAALFAVYVLLKLVISSCSSNNNMKSKCE